MTVAVDAIVVGAGAAGCVVARRLADSGRAVTLVEAGPGGARPSTVDGLDTITASDEPSRLWPGLAVRERADGQLRPYRQGYGLGGGTTINSLVLTPCDRADYDRWSQTNGCTGWAASDMDPWLERAMAPFGTTEATLGPLAGRFEHAAAAAGHPVGGSTADQDRLGALRPRLAAADGGRRSVADLYLPARADGAAMEPGPGPGPGPGIVEVVAATAVRRVVASGDRTDGVELESGERLDAPLVVLSAGALQTPAILQRSGLGRAGVGRGLKDHPSFTLTLLVRPEAVGQDPDPAHRAVTSVLRWSSGLGPDGDLQAFVIDRVDRGLAAGERPMAAVVIGLMAVTSVGSVGPSTITDRDRRGGPTVVTGALSVGADRARLRAGVAAIADLVGSEAMADFVEGVAIDDRGTPIERMMAMDDATLDRWLLDHPGPYAHPACTCPLGPDAEPAAIVDHRPGSMGLVHGQPGLRIADASIMPDLVAGGLQVPVMAIAERVADDIIRAG